MDLRESSLGFYRAWFAALGARHGLFLALRDAPLASDVLAAELGLAPEPTRRWCEGAWALGLLARDARGRYRLAAEHRGTLGEPASLAYLGHHFDYLARKSLGFGELDVLLAGAGAALDAARTYAVATRWDHVAFFATLEAPLRRALARGIDVLDLGAGEGGWTREASARFPASRFVAADLRARRLPGLRIREARRLPAAAFDLVFLGEVLAAAPDPAAPLAGAFRALRPGGRLVALEGLRPSGRRRPRGWGPTLVTAMGLDFSLDGSRFLGEEEARRGLRLAGFASARVRDLGGSLFRIDARKPQA